MIKIVRKVTRIARIRWLPWLAVGLIFLAALLHETIGPAWLGHLPREVQALVWALALVGLLALFLVGEQFRRWQAEKQAMQEQIAEANRQVEDAYHRLETIFRLSQKFVEVSDENEVIQLVLQLCVDLVGAAGASFVPLDEHGQPLTALRYGEMPFPVMTAWVEYLASPSIRQRCETCDKQGALTDSCPLLKGPFSDAIGMFCLPLRSGEREFGVFNLYMPSIEQIDPKTDTFLRAMLDETALALEGVRLRRRELSALRQMQAMRQKRDLKGMLSGLLEDVQEALDADFALLVVENPEGTRARTILGELPKQAQPIIDGILHGVMSSGEPVLLGDVAGAPVSNPGVRSLMSAPLVTQDQVILGAVVAGNRRSQAFHPRQLALLQTITGQVAMVVQNANWMAELEYKTVIQERTRLAREIHDGLAQTLGFLKLQAAQMQNYLERSELERLRKAVDLSYTTLSEAYQDARQAIDGLRIGLADTGLSGWLRQIVDEFHEISGVDVILEDEDLTIDLLPEVHAQLIRIVQEALNNVRKHAGATKAWVSFGQSTGDFWLEVRDNGRGFSPEDVPSTSHHGLKGMRERAELIGADFQMISRVGDGTTVRVRLPLVGMHSKDSPNLADS